MRKLRNSKPVSETPVSPELSPETPETPVIAPETETPAPATIAKPDPVAAASERRIGRDARTISAFRTHFGTQSDRDASYAVFFLLAGAETGSFSLKQADEFGIRNAAGSSRNPLYNGSNKATDAGAVNRLRHAGYIIPADDSCKSFTFTERGLSFARNELAKLKPSEPAS